MILLTAQAASGSADVETITTVQLVMIGILIVLVIGAIIWGARQKRTRLEGERLAAERNEQILAHPQTETAVSPAPPPLGGAGFVAPPAPSLTAKPKPVAKAAPVAKPKPVAKAAPVKAAPKPTPAPAPAAKLVAPKPAAKTSTAKVVAKAPAPKPVAAKVAVAKPIAKAAPANPAAKPAAKTVVKAAPKPAAATSSYGLIDVKGLGPKAVPVLAGLGVNTLADLAGLSAARAAQVDGQLGALSGRLARDKWVEQAKLLTAGDVPAFEKAYGKL